MAPLLCAHLEPLVHHLRTLGVEVAPCASPYGDTTFTWWRVGCVFRDAQRLRRRLGLDDALEYAENFAFAAGSEATWTCREHQIILIGPHPATAAEEVPRVDG